MKQAEIEADVLIVGAGLVGGGLAAALGTAGLEVALIDREDPAALGHETADGRASAIALGSWRVLEGIGLMRHVGEAEPIADIRVSDGASPFVLRYDPGDLGGDLTGAPFGYIVENTVLRRATFARLAELPNVRLLAPASVSAIERGAGGVAGALADGRALRARLAVSAEGRGSRLRADAGIRTTEWSYPQTGIVCTVAHDRPHGGVAHEHFLPSGPFASLPMTGNRSSIVWTERTELAPAALALDDDAFSAELQRRFGDWLGGVRVVGRRWSYKLGLMHAERYADHRLALVGDAAHVIHPIAGQGLNLGLRDIAALAETVVDAARLGLDIGARDVLAGYERWRRFDNLALIAMTDALNRLFSNDVAPIRWARDLGLAAVDRMPGLKRLFMRHAMGLVGTLPRLVAGQPL